MLFYELCDYKMVLEIASDMLGVVSWDAKTPQFISYEHLKVSESEYPNYLNYSVRRNIDIFHDKWDRDRISLEDIERDFTAVNKRRGFP